MQDELMRGGALLEVLNSDSSLVTKADQEIHDI